MRSRCQSETAGHGSGEGACARPPNGGGAGRGRPTRCPASLAVRVVIHEWRPAFESPASEAALQPWEVPAAGSRPPSRASVVWRTAPGNALPGGRRYSCLRSEEHTSELQSLRHLVCRLLLEK